MGNEVLTEWAVSRIEKSEADLPQYGDIVRSGQKKHVGYTGHMMIAPVETMTAFSGNTHPRSRKIP